MHRTTRLYSVAAVLCIPFVAGAQEKRRFASLEEALQAGAILNGRQGPQNVNWIEGGRRYSYTDRDPQTNAPVIRAYNPASGKDTTLFATSGLTFPGTNKPFSYDSFQWAQDSKHLVFQANFQPALDIQRRFFVRNGVATIGARLSAPQKMPRGPLRASFGSSKGHRYM